MTSFLAMRDKQPDRCDATHSSMSFLQSDTRPVVDMCKRTETELALISELLDILLLASYHGNSISMKYGDATRIRLDLTHLAYSTFTSSQADRQI